MSGCDCFSICDNHFGRTNNHEYETSSDTFSNADLVHDRGHGHRRGCGKNAPSGTTISVEQVYKAATIPAGYQIVTIQTPVENGKPIQFGIGGIDFAQDGTVVVAQKPELTLLTDTDGDGIADLYKTICDRWRAGGNYCEYVHGPVIDSAGNYYISINLSDAARDAACNKAGGTTLGYDGWASVGGKTEGLQRIAWDGKTIPFEIHSMKLTKTGFAVRFTRPVDPRTVREAGAVSFKHWHYHYHGKYGSPKVDLADDTATVRLISNDGQTVVVDLPLKEGQSFKTMKIGCFALIDAFHTLDHQLARIQEMGFECADITDNHDRLSR